MNNDECRDKANLNNKNGDNFWSKPMENIVWGFIFTMMTFNFWGLQYILPTIGVGLLYLGFRDLRNENKALYATWIFSIINMALNLCTLIYISTPMNVNFNSSGIYIFISTIFQLSFLLTFRAGLKNIFEKTNKKPSRDPIFWLVIWRISIIAIVLFELGNEISFIPLILWYIYLCNSLYKLCNELDLDNIVVTKVNFMISNKKIMILYIIASIFTVAVCSVSSNNIKLESAEFVKAESSQNRDNLIKLGFPEEIINDISKDDIDILQDAISVDSSNNMLMFDYENVRIDNEFGGYSNEVKPGKYNLDATTLYVELKDNRMYAFDYFKWKDGGAYWNDGFSIVSTQPLSLIGGRLLYNKDDTSYVAPIPRLKKGVFKENNMFGSGNESERITGAVNYPFNSDIQRGYVFYKINIPKGGWAGNTILNYYHYNNPFRLPYSEPEQNNEMFSNKLRQHSATFNNKAYGE